MPQLEKETDHLEEFVGFMQDAHEINVYLNDKPDFDDCAWEDYKIARHSKEDEE